MVYLVKDDQAAPAHSRSTAVLPLPPPQPNRRRSVTRSRMASLFSFSKKGGTFRSVKNVPVGAKGLTLKQHIEHTLGTGAVEDAVRLPPGEDMNEWLAVNTGGKAGWLSWLASLGQGAVGEAVRLPLGEGMNEWPAVNTGGPVCLSR